MVTITQYGLPLESWPKQQNKKHKIALSPHSAWVYNFLGLCCYTLLESGTCHYCRDLDMTPTPWTVKRIKRNLHTTVMFKMCSQTLKDVIH